MKLTREQVILLFQEYTLIDDLGLFYDEISFDADDENMLIIIAKDPDELPWRLDINAADLDVRNKTLTFDADAVFAIVKIPSSDALCDVLNIPINFN